MKHLTIIISNDTTQMNSKIASISIPHETTPPTRTLKSWQDFIEWLLQNPEIILELLRAIFNAFRPNTPPLKAA